MFESNINMILDRLYTHSKRNLLNDDIFYPINANNEIITLRVDKNRITLFRYN
jgi:hypothetical protein